MLSELATGLPIPLEKRAYFHARVLNSFYQYIFRKFLEEEQAGRLTKAELARRIERRPEVVSRLLGAPGNWTLETATDLLLGISGEELKPDSSPLLGRPPRNYKHANWLISVPLSTNAPSSVRFWRDPQQLYPAEPNPLQIRKESVAGTTKSVIATVNESTDASV
jgi:hypothetical protein